jgi:amino acid transporter
VFFAYIGFDTVACSAEESANPQVDVPVGMMGSLAVVTVLYAGVAIVLTLMQPYAEMNVSAPLSYAFVAHGAHWAQFIVSAGSLCALFTTILTSYYAQSRIFFAMARDGMLPSVLARVMGKRRNPVPSVALSMLLGASLACLVDLEDLAEMVSIGTLVALVLCCAAVLVLRYESADATRSRRQPLIITAIVIGLFAVASGLYRFQQPIWAFSFYVLGFIATVPLAWLPQSTVSLAFRTPFLPFVPCLGLALNLFMMASLSDATWIRLFVWTGVGLIVYFGYSIRHSRIGSALAHSDEHVVNDDDTTRVTTAAVALESEVT